MNRMRDERESDARYSLAPYDVVNAGAHVADVGQSSQDTVISNLPYQKMVAKARYSLPLLHRLAYRLYLEHRVLTVLRSPTTHIVR